MSRARRAAAWGLLACALAGCEDDQPVPPARRGIGTPSRATPQPSDQPTQGSRPSSASQEVERRASETERIAARPEPFEVQRKARVSDEPTPEARHAAKGRDLEAALRDKLAGTVNCVSGHLRPDPPQRLRIEAEVVVTGSGVISRASVEAPHVEAEGLRCMERELAAQRFSAPVPDAPRQVRASVEMQRDDT